jgi:tRNA dimethylallyltransferase
MAAKPLVVIVGPTASGKTALAVSLAEKFGGEIICADSRTVYKGMDIGTAKPTNAEREKVPHWGLDLIEPNESFTVADFKQYTNEKISEIRARGHVPFLVGGTGLYVDAVVFDYQFGPPADPELRKHLENMTLEELYIHCKNNNIELPENHKNKRYVIRAIEQKSINIKRRTEPVDNTIIVGIATDRDILRTRIEHRSEQLFTDGVVDEAKLLGDKYGWDHESMTGNIYPLCRAYLQGEMSLSEVKEKFITLDWRLAKRQVTWLKRNQHIEWLSRSEAEQRLVSVLASEQ